MSNMHHRPPGLIPDAHPVLLGPFRLLRLVGTGGMGQIWRARHRDLGHEVAVKVLTRALSGDAVFQQGLRDEVRAQARLDHPGVVQVFEQGLVSREAAQRFAELRRSPEWPGRDRRLGRFHDGTPWLAMELAPFGSLDQYWDPMDWKGVRGLLLGLLDALAHAHARGVVHRDLKPENLLVFRRARERGGAPGTKIADFGLARAVEEAVGTEVLAGTPRYMAPEQFQGQLFDQGPWTDLYAVGCIAWELLAGKPLFPGSDPAALRHAHLMREPPPLPDRVRAPPGVDGWLRRLLAKVPEARFSFAADAAWALLALGEAPDANMGAGGVAREAVASARTLVFSENPVTTLAWALDSVVLHLPTAGLEAVDDGEPPVNGPVSPFPRSWRRPGAGRAAGGLPGIGLGLFGVRAIPMVGRAADRDEIWSQLGAVRDDGLARAVVLRGDAGVGKSRLAGWIGERYHEVGGGPTLRAVHAAGEGAGVALENMVARHLGCVGLDPGEADARIRALMGRNGVVDPYEARGLAALIARHTAARSEGGGLGRAARHALLRRLLLRAGGGRPVLLWLDDVHWDSESLAFAKWLLQTRESGPTPVLMLLTVRDEDLESQPMPALAGGARAASSDDLDQLDRLDGALTLQLGPLPAEAHSRLVRELLGLTGALAAQVERRTAGNPLFAVQLVGDWVRRAVLVPSTSGYRLRAGAEPHIPDDLHQVWSERIRDLVRGRPPGFESSLELAALLGVEVRREEWIEVCACANVVASVLLVEDLVAERLWVPFSWGWAFGHAMLRESLVRRAREGNRSQAWHRACAEVLQADWERGLAGVAERLGRHLLGAGEDDAALRPLLDGAVERLHRGELDRVRALLDAVVQAMDNVDMPAADPRRGRHALLSAEHRVASGELEAGLEEAARTAGLAVVHGWTVVRADALRLQGHAIWRQGDRREAGELFQQAWEAFRELGELKEAADCLQLLSKAALRSGELGRARGLARQALLASERLGVPIGMARARMVLCDLARAQGELGTAGVQARQARAGFRAAGDIIGEGFALAAMGHVSRSLGLLDEAQKHYGDALLRFDAAGSKEGDLVRLHVVFLLLLQGHPQDSLRLLERCVGSFTRSGRVAALGSAGVLTMAHLAREQNWIAWSAERQRAAERLRSAGRLDADIAVFLGYAGDVAESMGADERAREAWQMAAEHWAALGVLRAEEAEPCPA